ncbi:MAG: hypothetical protein ACF788_09245, partial [Novipirellula sp. JB048]
MNASTSGRIDAAHAQPTKPTVAGDPQQCIASIAQHSGDRAEFIRRLARHLQTEFGVGLVAVVAPQYEQPIMLVVDEELGAQVHRPSIRRSLQLATAVATASEVALIGPVDPDDPGIDAGGPIDPAGEAPDDDSPPPPAANDLGLSVRGYRIELMAAPERLAVLLVHRVRERPSPAEQLQILHRLSLYGSSIRELEAVPVSPDAGSAVPETDSPSPASEPEPANVGLATVAGQRTGAGWLA